MDEKRIIRNRAKCNGCLQIIESSGRHHFVTCECGSTSVDGGTAYLRRLWTDEVGGFTELSEVAE